MTWLDTLDQLKQRLTHTTDRDTRKALKQAIYDLTEQHLGTADRRSPDQGQGPTHHVLRRPSRERTP